MGCTGGWWPANTCTVPWQRLQAAVCGGLHGQAAGLHNCALCMRTRYCACCRCGVALDLPPRLCNQLSVAHSHSQLQLFQTSSSQPSLPKRTNTAALKHQHKPCAQARASRRTSRLPAFKAPAERTRRRCKSAPPTATAAGPVRCAKPLLGTLHEAGARAAGVGGLPRWAGRVTSVPPPPPHQDLHPPTPPFHLCPPCCSAARPPRRTSWWSS